MCSSDLATSVYEFRNMGYMPDSVFNFLALLGWSAGEDREIFTRGEAASLFELSRVTRKAAVFDPDKLNFINQEHLCGCSPCSGAATLRRARSSSWASVRSISTARRSHAPTVQSC